MSINVLHKLQKVMLFLMIIFLPFSSIPKRFSIPGLGQNLSTYCLLVGIVLLIYEYIKHKFVIKKCWKLFFTIYIVWQIICLAKGLMCYEYNEYLTLDQIPRLKYILEKLALHGIVVPPLMAIKTWLFIRFSKNIVLINNTVFIVAFYVYHLYHSDFKCAFRDIRKAILWLVLFMGLYSIIELAWLKGNSMSAKNLLMMVNPYIFDPKQLNGWWPPLLWNGQLRSLTTEPSFFGIISIMCLPILWSFLFDENFKYRYIAVLGYFTFMIAATNARTAIVVTLGELFLLICSACIVKKLDYLKKVGLILIVTGIAFSINLIDFSKANSNMEQALEKYTEQNVTSMTNTNARSNNARLANLVANLNTIKDFPIMGVGTGLKDIYMDVRLPEFSFSNNEVRNWSRDMHREGVLKSGYPSLNQYTDIASQNGLIGLFLYLFPIGYSIYRLVSYGKIIFKDYNLIMLLISMIGLLFAQLSNAAFVVCNGFIWGLLFCKIDKLTNNKYIIS